MLAEILQFLRNWFIKSIHTGIIDIQDGEIKTINGTVADGLFLDGQYIRIIGSALNDGVYQHGSEELADERFYGTVWGLGIPHAVLDLVAEIEEWQTKNGTQAASPFTSESFGGYSYSKNTGSDGSASWQSAYMSRLTPWRKI